MKVSICEEDITLLTIHAPNRGEPKYIKQILTDLSGEIAIQKQYGIQYPTLNNGQIIQTENQYGNIGIKLQLIKVDHTLISIDSEKAFDKIQHLFMIKNSQQIVDRRDLPQIRKAVLDKTTTNVILNSEKLKVFFPKVRHSTRMPTHHFYSTWYWKSQSIRQEKEMASKSERKK